MKEGKNNSKTANNVSIYRVPTKTQKLNHRSDIICNQNQKQQEQAEDSRGQVEFNSMWESCRMNYSTWHLGSKLII